MCYTRIKNVGARLRYRKFLVTEVQGFTRIISRLLIRVRYLTSPTISSNESLGAQKILMLIMAFLSVENWMFDQNSWRQIWGQTLEWFLLLKWSLFRFQFISFLSELKKNFKTTMISFFGRKLEFFLQLFFSKIQPWGKMIIVQKCFEHEI